MPDGVVLLADRWYPTDRPDAPIVLARSPYGRRQLDLFGRILAGQGYQTVIQSVRGTFGSGGAWRPFFNEQTDGRATLDWLSAQPWFTPRVATFGPSYLGLTQFSIAQDPPEWLRGMAIAVSATGFRDAVIHPGNAFGLDLAMSWIHGLEIQEEPFRKRAAARVTGERLMAASAALLPVGVADRALTGRTVDYYQEWVEHEMPGDPFWAPIDFASAVPTAPSISLLAGWYDIFLPQQVDDFVALTAAERPVRITIGPWHHSQPAGLIRMVRDAVDHFRLVLDAGGSHHSGDPVRLFVMGRNRWRTFPSWPPPARRHEWRLGPDGTLRSADRPEAWGAEAWGAEAPGTVAWGTVAFRYRPSDPTPAVGGRALNSKHAGAREQTRRESRDDVLVFSSEPMKEELTVIGVATVRVHLSTDAADLFVRLCDVGPTGRSINVCDAGVRVQPADIERHDDGTMSVSVRLAPTAHAFRRGHRIRLQISGGAYPLMSRYPGPGERLRTGVPTRESDYEVVLGSSTVELPVVG